MSFPTVITEPAIEPLTLAEVKLHCRVDYTDDDAMLQAFITAARRRAENYLGRKLISQQVQWSFSNDLFWLQPYNDAYNTRMQIDSFFTRNAMYPMPGRWMIVHYPNVQSIDSFQYYDTGENLQTVDPNVFRIVNLNDPSNVCFLELILGGVWPVPSIRANPWIMKYTVGFGSDPASIPSDLKIGMLMEIATWYENRENLAPINLLPVKSGTQAIYAHWRWEWSV